MFQLIGTDKNGNQLYRDTASGQTKVIPKTTTTNASNTVSAKTLADSHAGWFDKVIEAYGGDQEAAAEAYKKITAYVDLHPEVMGDENYREKIASQVIATPSAWAPNWAEKQTAVNAQRTADTVAAPLLENAKLQSDAAKTESRGYIDRLLASRGITSSGAVGANIAKSDLGYANALQSAQNTIKSGALNNALGREQQVLDNNVAQTYADQMNTQYMGAINAQKQSSQPTFWDYASSILGGIGGIGKGIDTLWGKK